MVDLARVRRHIKSNRTDRFELISGPETMDINQEFWTWVVAYTQNLRRFRRVGPEPETWERLAAIARAEWKAIYTRNGWPEESEGVPGIAPLQEADLAPDGGEHP